MAHPALKYVSVVASIALIAVVFQNCKAHMSDELADGASLGPASCTQTTTALECTQTPAGTSNGTQGNGSTNLGFGTLVVNSTTINSTTNTNLPTTSSVVFNFVAPTKEDCEQSINTRLGIAATCKLAGGCGANCGVPGANCPSANPTQFGACIMASYGGNTVMGTTTQTYNFVAADAMACSTSVFQKLGVQRNCSVGGGCGTACGVPGPNCPSANPTQPGACIEAFFKLPN